MAKSLEITSADLKRLAWEHLEDAKALLVTERFAGAIYLAGYALECAVKFRICETLGWLVFPPDGGHQALKSHNLNFLLNYSGKFLEVQKKHLSVWQVAETWSPEMRYDRRTPVERLDCLWYLRSAESLLNLFIYDIS
jgi:hypothetical protein